MSSWNKGAPLGAAIGTCFLFLGIGPAWNAIERLRDDGRPHCPVAVHHVPAHDVAQAIPAFSRKFNVPCQTCHIEPPYLNATGRKFMEAGYRMPDEDGTIDEAEQNHQQINQNLVLEKMVPFAIRLQSVPVTATTGQPIQSQPLSDFDIIAFGNFYRYGSFHFALGAGADEGFAPAADGRLGLHPSPYFNVVAGFGGAFSADPYNTFRTGDVGLTRVDKAALTDGHDSLTALDDDRQFLEFYGRAGIVYYMAGLVGATDLTTGELPETGVARIAVDPMENVSFGAFGMGGRRVGGDASGGPKQDAALWRAGVDFDTTVQEFTAVAAFVAAGDSVGNAAQKTSLGGFVEGMYAVRVDGRPILLPLVRVDWTQDNGGDHVLGGAFDLSSSVFENVRVGAEASYSAPVTSDFTKGTAAGTLFADVVF